MKRKDKCYLENRYLPCRSRQSLSQSIPCSRRWFHSTWQHGAFGAWAAPPPAFPSCQPQSHPQPWPSSESSRPCAAESPLKACSEDVGGPSGKARPCAAPLLHHTGQESIWEILGALRAPGWHFQTHPRRLGAASEYDTNFIEWFYNLQGKREKCLWSISTQH